MRLKASRKATQANELLNVISKNEKEREKYFWTAAVAAAEALRVIVRAETCE